MTRPSHWILGLFACVGGALWLSGSVQEFLAAKPAESSIVGNRGNASQKSSQKSTRATPIAADGSRRASSQGRARTPDAPKLSEVAGTVLDRRGWPVVAARVRFAHDAAVEPVETDAFGRFRLRGFAAVNRWLSIEAPGRHAPLLVHGSTQDLPVVLHDALPWAEPATAAAASPDVDLLVGEGWVRTAKGEPAVGAHVMVAETKASARVDDQGRFLLPLPPTACTITAWTANGECKVLECPVPLRKEGKVPLPEVDLAVGHTLRGRLRDPDGGSMVDAAIVVANAGVERTVRSEQGGLFVANGLVSGDVTVSVLPTRGHLPRRVHVVLERDADMGDVELARAEREPLRISVASRDGEARPFVHVVADQAEGLCRAYGQANARGEVSFVGIGTEALSFEVRDTELVPMTVLSFSAENRRLVVEP